MGFFFFVVVVFLCGFKKTGMQLNYKLLWMLYLILSVFTLAQWPLATYQSLYLLWSGAISSLLSPVILVYSFAGIECLPPATLLLILNWLAGEKEAGMGMEELWRIVCRWQKQVLNISTTSLYMQSFKDCLCKMASQPVEDFRCDYIIVHISIIFHFLYPF